VLKKSGNSVYHLCYEVDDQAGAVKVIEGIGLKVAEISSAKPAILFDGRLVSFYYIPGFGLIELLSRS
jgi:hypothetical protein